MRIRTQSRVCFLLTLMVLAPVASSPPPALAARASRAVSDVTTITDTAGHSRILFRASPSIEVENFAISRAYLHFNLSGVSEERTLRLRLHSLTSPWSAGTADWARGWTTAGGDLDGEVSSDLDVELTRGAQEIAWDVTVLLKEFLRGGRTSHGFLLTCDASDGVGLSSADRERLASLGAAELEVRYRKTPPVPGVVAAQDSSQVR